jgi:hypothetical protein
MAHPSSGLFRTVAKTYAAFVQTISHLISGFTTQRLNARDQIRSIFPQGIQILFKFHGFIFHKPTNYQ